MKLELDNDVFDIMNQQHEKILLLEYRWRYSVGKEANTQHDKLVAENKATQNKYKKVKSLVTGIGAAFADKLDLSQSDISRYRGLARIFTLEQIEHRIKLGWRWDFFKLIINNHEVLGVKSYEIPTHTNHEIFKKWLAFNVALVNNK